MSLLGPIESARYCGISHFINVSIHTPFTVKVDSLTRTLSTDVGILLFVAVHEASVDVVRSLAGAKRWHKVNTFETHESTNVNHAKPTLKKVRDPKHPGPSSGSDNIDPY